jgi:hypothetical protein
MEPVKHAVAKALVAAGSVRGATVIGQPGGWAIVLRVGIGERVIAAKRGGVRMFATLDAAQRLLRELGIVRFEVDATHHAPECIGA